MLSNFKKSKIHFSLVALCIVLCSFFITFTILWNTIPLLSDIGLTSSLDNTKLSKAVSKIDIPSNYEEITRNYYPNSMGTFASIDITYKAHNGIKAKKEDFIPFLEQAGYKNSYDKFSYVKEGSFLQSDYHVNLTDDSDKLSNELTTNEVYLDMYID